MQGCVDIGQFPLLFQAPDSIQWNPSRKLFAILRESEIKNDPPEN